MGVREIVFVIVTVCGAFLFVGSVVWMISRSQQTRVKLRAEIQRELLAKFSTGRELVEFLNTEEGRRFTQELYGAGEHATQKALDHLRIGVFFLALGTGLAVAGNLLADNDLYIPAAVFGAMGIGFIAGSFLSRSLAKSGKVKTPEVTAGRINRGKPDLHD